MPLCLQRTWRHVPATAAITALITGCGGGGGGAGSGAPPSAATSAPSAVAAPASVSQSPQVASVLRLDPQLPSYAPTLPAHFAGAEAQDNSPAGTVESPVVATLGRVLFYERQLSTSGTVSCATCHNQATDFADAGRFSLGVDGLVGNRHAMRLANVRYYQPATMFWDKRSATLQDQVTQPVQNPVEQGFDAAHGGLAAATQRLQQLPYYTELFTAAFGDPAINEQRVQQALAQFVRGIVSTSSRWDEGAAQVFDATLPDKGFNKPFPNFTEEENRGRFLFMAPRNEGGQNCAACHAPPTFALTNSGNNGLDAGETVRFKSPSLKNVARSGAFMHDGRFSSLEQVVEHYSSGVQDTPALDGRLKNPDGTPARPNLSEQDKAALVAFLKTLSDPVLAADPRFSDPFRASATAAAPESQ